MIEYPKIQIWVTSCGRIHYLKPTIDSFIQQCTYPNYEMVIIESQMTEVSKKFFALEHVHERETAEYINSLPGTYPNIKFNIHIQPFRILGQTYDQLLAMTGDYFLNIEDDLVTVCDPAKEILDGIRLLDRDPELLGMRTDLRDETVYEGCPRFSEMKETDGYKYFVWRDWCSGGAQIMDARKTRAIGGYITDHEPNNYIMTEKDQSAKMRTAKMYTGIGLRYYGFLAHIGGHGVQGGDRIWTVEAYQDLAKSGWCGDGTQKKPREHNRDYYINRRRDNGKP